MAKEPEGLNLLEQVTVLQNMLVARARGDTQSEFDYQKLRRGLQANPAASKLLPSFVRTCQNLSQFWAFIKPKFPTWAERDKFIWAEFRPLVDKLEGGSSAPADSAVNVALDSFDVLRVRQIWETAIDRREGDPEGAITIARTLLESVMKHILDEAKVTYAEKDDLPRLYKLTAEQLKLSPSQHEEQVFRQILGACHTVVEGLGTMRNKLGDAHGRGKKSVKPAARHAALAVNLGGAMAMFLVETWSARAQENCSQIPR